MNLRRLSAALMLTFLLAPATAWAQDADKATARQLTIDGYEALKKRDYAAAADRFARAEALYHAPTILLGLARARVGLGKLVGAQEAYSRIVHDPVVQGASPKMLQAIADANTELEALAPRVPNVVIDVKGAEDPRVTIDGDEVPRAALGVKRPVDPGNHVVRATAHGFTASETTVTLGEGKTATVSLELKRDPGARPDIPPPSVPLVVAPAITGTTAESSVLNESPTPPVKRMGFVALGVGGAGLIVGGIAGGLALAKHGDLVAKCPEGHCPPSQKTALQGDIDAYHTMGAVSVAGFIAGGALAATGVILVVTAPKAKPQSAATWTPVLGLGYLGAQGSF